MDSSEVGPVFAELYMVVVYVYWTDDKDAKKTIAYRPDGKDQTFDGGFVTMFKGDYRMSGDVIIRN